MLPSTRFSCTASAIFATWTVLIAGSVSGQTTNDAAEAGNPVTERRIIQILPGVQISEGNLRQNWQLNSTDREFRNLPPVRVVNTAAAKPSNGSSGSSKSGLANPAPPPGDESQGNEKTEDKIPSIIRSIPPVPSPLLELNSIEPGGNLQKDDLLKPVPSNPLTEPLFQDQENDQNQLEGDPAGPAPDFDPRNDIRNPEPPGAGRSDSGIGLERLEGLWWRKEVARGVTGLPNQEPLNVAILVQQGLQSSPNILALSQTPLIRESEIGVALAEFDPVLFTNTLYDDRVDPVGNTLTTGGLPFLKDNIWSGEAGFRQRLYTGGQLQVSQRLGFQNSNSRFFVPQDQGTATLAINFEQPLTRGRGQYINRSQIFLAETATLAAHDELAARLQEELNLIVSAYWNLYATRAQLLQRERNFEMGRRVVERLEGRSGFDTQPLQLAQARAAFSLRETALANARRDVRIAESEIRRLVGAAQWQSYGNVELVTAEAPMEDPGLVSMEDAILLSLQNRPELRQATQRVKAAGIRNNVTANELLPDLRLLFSTYVSALAGGSGIETAWQRQFDGSTPGFSGGLQFEFPWRNRAARSRHQQTALELTRAQYELEQQTVNVIADAQQSWYRVVSANERLSSGIMALEAARAELEQNELRWGNAAIVEGDWSDGQTQSLILDQLLQSQQKLFEAERVVVESEQELKLAQINLKRATGTLLASCQGGPDETVLKTIEQAPNFSPLPPENPANSSDQAPCYDPAESPSR